MSPFVLFSVTLLVFLVIIWKTCFSSRKVNLPPLAPWALPFLGHFWLGFVKNERFYEIFMKLITNACSQRDDNIVRIQIGTLEVNMFVDPEGSYSMMNSCLKKDYIYELLHEWGGDKGLLTADVSTWKVHRKIFNLTFNQSVLDSYLIEFNHRSRQLVEQNIIDKVGKGPFDQMPFLRQVVLQAVFTTMMGVRVDQNKTLIEDYGKASETYTHCMTARLKKFYYHSDILFNLSNLKKKQDLAAKIIHDISTQVLRKKKEELFAQDERKKENGNTCGVDRSTIKPRFKSFIDLLLEVANDGSLTESEIRQEIDTFIGAAFDTTYHALGMVLLILGSYPEVQQKVFDELQEVFQGSLRDVEKQDISKLKYLAAVIKETLRLYPTVILVGRVLDKDVKLKKYTLPTGSRCFISIYHLGRHRCWGSDADMFRPERWLDGNLPSNVKSYAYAVFGLGRRNCIGSNFAIMLMKTVLSHVVRRYRISGDVTKLVQNIDVVITPISGHHISLHRRDEK